MVKTRSNERPATVPRGSRIVFAAAILVTLSGFAKETATVLLDLPKPRLVIMRVVAAAPAAKTPAAPRKLRIPALSTLPTGLVSGLATGLASWYGTALHDHRTASGERFNMFELTAAHRSFPFGSKVKVTDLRNRRSIIVTITDRGIMKADRIIDLSYAAAERLGMLQAGVDPVRLELLKPEQALLAEAELASQP